MRKTAVILSLVALAGFSGCGDDDEDTTSNSSSGATTTETQDAPAPAGDGQVVMKGIKFQPADVTVKVGDTVTWTNEDPVQHDAVDEEGGQFKSELFGEGGTYEFTTTKAGTIKYVCTIHPGMTGTVTVTE